MVVLEVAEKTFEAMTGKFCKVLEGASVSSLSFALTSMTFWIPLD